MLCRLVDRAIPAMPAGRLQLTLPNGEIIERHGTVPGPDAIMTAHRWRGLRRMLLDGDHGFADGYLDGDWSTPELGQLLEFCMHNESALTATAAVGWLGLVRNRFVHWLRYNTRRGSRRNIAAHYDLGNSFYSEWLDPTMTYSSALFESREMSLEEAQRAKWRRMAEMLDLNPSHRVLEIGCGWGGFAMFAAREYGCHVTGITLSREQYAYATQEVSRAGLSRLIDIRFEDYRDTRGEFDRVVSIEMFEAVGEENWPRYFEVVRDRLKPGGMAGLQIITIDDHDFEIYRKGADFIQLYIFPGGMLPSPSALRQAVMCQGLGFETVRTFALSYAETLRRWRESFDARWPRIAPMGFDERFRRMWDYYLASCEGGFRAGSIDVGQFRLTRA
jgi:cyclopropane-fatty-acyl-phospholipid synthase